MGSHNSTEYTHTHPIHIPSCSAQITSFADASWLLLAWLVAVRTWLPAWLPGPALPTPAHAMMDHPHHCCVLSGGRVGLAGSEQLSHDQLPNTCAYNSANWAMEARRMGRSFFEMTMERIREYNTPAFVQLGNADIGIDSTVARLLTGDNILRIVSNNNPDGTGQAPA